MTRRRVVGAVLALFLALVAFVVVTWPRDDGEQPVLLAVVSILGGSVSREPAGGAAVDAFDGDTLAEGDAVATAADGRALITLFEGTTITLEPETRVVMRTLMRNDDGTYAIVLEQTEGTSWASVTTVQDARSKVELKVPDATLEVHGTTLLTQVSKGKASTVFVSDGRVQLVTIKGGSAEIPPGGIGVYSTGDNAFYHADACTERPPGFVYSSFGFQMDPCSSTSRLAWRLALAGDSDTAGKVTDYYGRSCGEGSRNIPLCSAATGRVNISGPQTGDYTLTLQRARGRGTGPVGAMLSATGSVCGGYFLTDCREAGQSQHISFDGVPEGTLVRFGFRVHQTTVGLAFEVSRVAQVVEPDPTPTHRPSASAATPPPGARGVQQCKAEAPGQVFAGGSVAERSGAFYAYASKNIGRPASLVVSEQDLAATIADGLKNTPQVRVVSTSIANSSVLVNGKLGDVPIGAQVALSVRGGKLDVTVQLKSVPLWAKDQVPRSLLDGWVAAMNESGARWDRIIWRDGCAALVGSGVAGGQGTSTGPAPTPPPGTPAKRYSENIVYLLQEGSRLTPSSTLEFVVEGCAGRTATLTAVSRSWQRSSLGPVSFPFSASVTTDPYVISIPAERFPAPGEYAWQWDVCGRGWQTTATIVEAPTAAPPPPPPRSWTSLGSWSGSSRRDKCSTAWALGIGEFCPMQPGPASIWSSPEVDVGTSWRVTWDLAGAGDSLVIDVWTLEGRRVNDIPGTDTVGRIRASGKGSKVIDGHPGRFRLGVQGWALKPGVSVSFTIEIADLR